MKILFFSDIHADWKALERLLETEADAYFSIGDLVSWARGLERAGQILRARQKPVYVIPGNHESAKDIQEFCAEYGFTDLHSRVEKVGEVNLAGLGYSNPTPFSTPGEYTEDEIQERLQAFAGLEPLVLACHCPPKNTSLDRARAGSHFGSKAVAEFVSANSPRYLLCGHIHEAEGVSEALGPEKKTKGLNVGKRGFLLDLAAIEVHEIH
jgi:uncharacterized protein